MSTRCEGPRVGYLRTQFWLGLVGGGSVAHTTGVVNALHARASVEVLTNDRLPGLHADVRQHELSPRSPVWLPDAWRESLYNRPFSRFAFERIARLGIDCLYHRVSVFSQHAPGLARSFGLPLVLEWNGPDAWIARHWGTQGTPLHTRVHQRALSHVTPALEARLLHAADRVVVAAEPLVEALQARGLPRERALLIPNGVDVSLYRDDLTSASVRAKLGWQEAMVFGFSGTFGPWHGPMELVRSIARFFESHPAERGRARFLLIGDGSLRAAAEAELAGSPWRDFVHFTGMLSQQEAREHLAVCDVFLSPHVPNPDGSRFFGSPTKLFEYMALGRPIIASRLGQIGEVLEHERNALLVPPGDVEALVHAMAELSNSPRKRHVLGAAARRDAVARHSWEGHVDALLDSIEPLRARPLSIAPGVAA